MRPERLADLNEGGGGCKFYISDLLRFKLYMCVHAICVWVACVCMWCVWCVFVNMCVHVCM